MVPSEARDACTRYYSSFQWLDHLDILLYSISGLGQIHALVYLVLVLVVLVLVQVLVLVLVLVLVFPPVLIMLVSC